MFAGAGPSQFDAVQYVEPAVNRQPGFRRELVEQITSFESISRNFLHGELLKCEFSDPGVFDKNFRRNSKISFIFSTFSGGGPLVSYLRFDRPLELIFTGN